MKLVELKNKKRICILGFGVEGKITLKFLKYFYPEKEYVIADEKDGKNYLKKQNDCDLVIKSPGIKNNFAKKPYTTATNIFFANVNNFTIGVTGTKGKSTTSHLIYSAIKASGKKVFLVGNIGKPMLEELLDYYKKKEIKNVEDLEKDKACFGDTIFVCELSSYQLSDIKYSPDISVFINIYNDHVDHHGNFHKYLKAKERIVKFSKKDDFVVYNQNSQKLENFTKNLKINKTPFVSSNFFNGYKRKLTLQGEHNMSNMKAAATVAKILKIKRNIVLETFSKIKPLKHRMNFIGEYKGINFYDDAISTTPESTIAALRTLKNVETIFLGGLDRNYNFKELGDEINKSKIRNIVLFPDSGKNIEKHLKADFFNILETREMKKAVEFAFKNTQKGKTCLLSNASPSYSLWKNFEEKGEEFVGYVKKLAKKDC